MIREREKEEIYKYGILGLLYLKKTKKTDEEEGD
jgi:hypothetical protein